MLFGRQISRKALTAAFGAVVLIPLGAFVIGYLAGPRHAQSLQDIDAQAGAGARTAETIVWEADTTPPPPAPITRVVSVESGDNLMGLLVRAGAERTQAHAAIASLKGKYNPRRDLDIGDTLHVTLAPESGIAGPEATYRLAALTLPVSYDKEVAVTMTDAGGFTADEVERPLVRELVRRAGKIDSSLFVAGREAQVPARVLAELIRIYSFDVDFQREIWAGDTFELMYEQFRDEKGRIVHEGEVQYARLTLRDTELPLYRYVTSKGDLDYFNAKGESVRKALMRTPIDGARLSSTFGKRRHPILGYTRMHKGVDFAAPTGTPIYAAGNGTIESIGRNGGYGNYIRIRHNGTYKTAYAHLSRFAKGMRRGSRVRQGQVIGYVGSTGRSTGPHLHYEVLRNDRQTNPLTLRLPSGEKLKGDELNRFAGVRDSLAQTFAQLQNGQVQVAKAGAGATN